MSLSGRDPLNPNSRNPLGFGRREVDQPTADQGVHRQRFDPLRKHLHEGQGDLEPKSIDKTDHDASPTIGHQQKRADKTFWKMFTQSAPESTLPASVPSEMQLLHNFATDDNGNISREKALFIADLIYRNQQNRLRSSRQNIVEQPGLRLTTEKKYGPKRKEVKGESDDDAYESGYEQGYQSGYESGSNSDYMAF